MSPNNEQRKLAAIMFTDMVGYSALSHRNEKLALELLGEQQLLLRSTFPKFNGREIKSTGDGFLVEFTSALEAAQCAVAIQKSLVEYNASTAPERRIQVRIGVHLGDVVLREADMFGDGVNIAARIEPLAEAGGICLSGPVFDQVANKLGVSLVKLGAPELKNIQTPVDVYRVVLPWHGGGAPVRPSVTKSKTHSNVRRVLLAGAAVFILVSIAFVWLYMHQPGGTPSMGSGPANGTSKSATVTASDQKSVAVLPFVNMSADKADEYLSDGMTEELLNVLAKVKALRVPGRTSSFAYKGKNEEGIFRKVGEQLHVTSVLEGSVRKSGNQLRITAQLINVADGFHLWSQTYDRDMTNILAIQSEIAQQVALALKGQLGVEETHVLAKKPTEDTEAYRLYLLGRYHFSKATQAGWTNAMNYYNQALQLDPSYALAYCGLADNYGWMGGNVMPGKHAWTKEKELAQKALACDPDLPEAHLSLGIALASLFDWPGGEREMKRALELSPKLALAHDQYGWLLMIRGRFDEAIAAQKKAVGLDPLSPLMLSDLGASLYHARRYDDAIGQFRQTLELDPNFAFAHLGLGASLLRKGATEAAIIEFQKAQTLDDLPSTKADLGYANALTGNPAKAEQILRELEELVNRRYVPSGAFVIVYLGLGEKEKALDWLEKCYEEQDGACWYLKVDPRYDSVRNEPRFQALLNKVAFPE